MSKEKLRHTIKHSDFEDLSISELVTLMDVSKITLDQLGAFVNAPRCNHENTKEYNAFGKLIVAIFEHIADINLAAENVLENKEPENSRDSEKRAWALICANTHGAETIQEMAARVAKYSADYSTIEFAERHGMLSDVGES